MPLAQREYLVVRVVGKTPRPAETTTRHCQPGGEGHTFGADSESEFLGLQLWASTPVASPAALRHHPRQEPRALTRMRGSVRGDWRKPVPYRDEALRMRMHLGEHEVAIWLGRVIKPKFSSWGKEVLCQVVDVDPITVLGNFKNG